MKLYLDACARAQGNINAKSDPCDKTKDISLHSDEETIHSLYVKLSGYMTETRQTWIDMFDDWLDEKHPV